MLVRPAPLPDELDRGYLGRVMRLNGVKNAERMQEHLYREFGLSYSKFNHPIAEAISLTAGMSIDQFMQRHSTAPFSRGIKFLRSHDPNEGLEHRPYRHYRFESLGCMPVYFCAECAKADIAFHGMAYWRRSMQVPGRVFCEKHGVALLRTTAEAVLDSPIQWIAKGELISDLAFSEVQKCERILHYLGAVDELMDRPIPMSLNSIKEFLRHRVWLMDVDDGVVSNLKQRPTILSLLNTEYPPLWLQHICSNFKEIKPDKLFDLLDAVVMNNYEARLPAWLFTLIGIAIHKNSEIAINEWTTKLRADVIPSPKTEAKTYHRQEANLHT